MTPERRFALSVLIRDGHVLLAQAEAGEWEGVALAQARHRRDAEAFFARAPVAGETPELTHALRELLTIQDQVTALATRDRDVLQARIHNVRLGRQAVRAYASSAA